MTADDLGFRLNQNAPPAAFAVVLAACFALLALVVVLNHEMYGDELGAWLIARGSHSFGEVADHLRYGGHPYLWGFCLYLLAAVSDDPLIVQLFHLGIAVVSAYVFARWAPFSRIQKTLFVFGYFPFFEYAVISRNYAFGVLFMFAACAGLAANPRRYVIAGIFLFLLAQTSVYGVMLVLAVGGYLVVEWGMDFLSARRIRPWSGELTILLLLALGGVAIALYQIIPPADGGYAAGWTFSFDWDHLLHTTKRVWRALAPMPPFIFHFWNQYILGPFWKSEVILAALTYAAVTVALLRRPKALSFWLIASCGLLAFTYIKLLGHSRHAGHLYLACIGAFWLASREPPRSYSSRWLSRLAVWGGRYRRSFLTGMFALQLAAGMYAGAMDISYPFSTSEDAAQLIRRQGLDRYPIVADMDYCTYAVSAYLDRPLYYPWSRSYGTFLIYDKRRQRIDHATMLQRARQLQRTEGQKLVLLLCYPLQNLPADVKPLGQTRQAILAREQYYIYELGLRPEWRPSPARSAGNTESQNSPRQH